MTYDFLFPKLEKLIIQLTARLPESCMQDCWQEIQMRLMKVDVPFDAEPDGRINHIIRNAKVDFVRKEVRSPVPVDSIIIFQLVDEKEINKYL